jgi:hypothetical protein
MSKSSFRAARPISIHKITSRAVTDTMAATCWPVEDGGEDMHDAIDSGRLEGRRGAACHRSRRLWGSTRGNLSDKRFAT